MKTKRKRQARCICKHTKQWHGPSYKNHSGKPEDYIRYGACRVILFGSTIDNQACRINGWCPCRQFISKKDYSKLKEKESQICQ